MNGFHHRNYANSQVIRASVANFNKFLVQLRRGADISSNQESSSNDREVPQRLLIAIQLEPSI